MSSSSDIEREVEASRDRLAATLDQLRDHLVPQNLMDEVLSRFRSSTESADATVVQRAESVIREHPLPAMLLGMGGALWFATGIQKRLGAYASSMAPLRGPSNGSAAGALPDGHAATPPSSASLRDNIADVGKSIADSAYQVLRAHAAAKIDEYTRSATSGINNASERLLDVVEEKLDKTVHSVSSTMQNRPVALSLIALALGAALGGAALTGDRR